MDRKKGISQKNKFVLVLGPAFLVMSLITMFSIYVVYQKFIEYQNGEWGTISPWLVLLPFAALLLFVFIFILYGTIRMYRRLHKEEWLTKHGWPADVTIISIESRSIDVRDTKVELYEVTFTFQDLKGLQRECSVLLNPEQVKEYEVGDKAKIKYDKDDSRSWVWLRNT